MGKIINYAKKIVGISSILFFLSTSEVGNSAVQHPPFPAGGVSAIFGGARRNRLFDTSPLDQAIVKICNDGKIYYKEIEDLYVGDLDVRSYHWVLPILTKQEDNLLISREGREHINNLINFYHITGDYLKEEGHNQRLEEILKKISNKNIEFIENYDYQSAYKKRLEDKLKQQKRAEILIYIFSGALVTFGVFIGANLYIDNKKVKKRKLRYKNKSKKSKSINNSF